jgi:HrpA-like RNA helicase
VYPRLAILATNVAESSLTLPGIGVTVDFAKAKIRYHETLRPHWIAKNNVRQRAGRAGRVMNGLCLTMMTRAEFDALAPSIVPEMQRMPLTSIVLRLLATGLIRDGTAGWAVANSFIAPPKEAEYSKAVALLESVGAMHGGKMTAVGATMSQFACCPEVTKTLMVGAMLGVLDHTALAMAAAFSHRVMIHAWDLNSFESTYDGDSMHSDIFTGATFLEMCRLCQDTPMNKHGVPACVVDEALALAQEYFTEAKAHVSVQENLKYAWLEQAWHAVDFAIMCGFGHNISIKADANNIEAQDGRRLRVLECGFHIHGDAAYELDHKHMRGSFLNISFL